MKELHATPESRVADTCTRVFKLVQCRSDVPRGCYEYFSVFVTLHAAVAALEHLPLSFTYHRQVKAYLTFVQNLETIKTSRGSKCVLIFLGGAYEWI